PDARSIMTTDLTTTAAILAAIEDPNGREIRDPATGEIVGRTRQGSPADIDAAVAAARRAQPAWAGQTAQERSDRLNAAADAIEGSAEARPGRPSRGQGKPLKGPTGRSEVGAGAAWRGRTRPSNSTPRSSSRTARPMP